MRKDGPDLWAMNPDGGTDTKYSASQVSSFLSSAPTTPSAFAGRDYLFTGIAMRAWK
jgi:hypothetical protein